jgi:hypothetical protein
MLCQGAASTVGHAGIGIGSRQPLIGMAGMLQLASMSGMLQLVSMPEEHATCMTMIAFRHYNTYSDTYVSQKRHVDSCSIVGNIMHAYEAVPSRSVQDKGHAQSSGP